MTEDRDKAYAWSVLLAFSMMFFLVTAATFTSLGVVLPDMVRDLGWDWTSAGLGFTLLGISCGLSSYPPAVMIRKVGIRWTVLFGTLLLVLGFSLLYSVQSVWMYFAGTILAGTGFSFVATVPGTYMIARCFTKQSMAFGIYFTLGGLGGIVGPLFYFAAVGFWDDWRMHWMIVAILIAIAGIVTAFVVRDDEEAERRARQVAEAALAQAPSAVYVTRQSWTAFQAVRTPQFYVIAASYVSFLLCGIAINSMSVAHLTEVGVAMSIAGGLLSAESVINSAARAGAGFIGEFIEPKILLVISLLCLVVGMIALTFGTSLPVLAIYVLGIGIGYGMTFLVTSVLLMNYFGRKPYLELFSLMNVAATLASCGPFLGGYMRDTFGTFTPAFLLYAAVPALVGVLVLFMKPPQRADEPEEHEAEAVEEAPAASLYAK